MSDPFTGDATLQATIAREVGDPWRSVAEEWLSHVAVTARERVAPLAWLADRHRPELRTHDPFGERVDEILYHPAHRELERLAYDELGLLAMKYDGAPFGMSEPAPQVLGFAALYLMAQAEVSLCASLALSDGVARVIGRYGDESLQRDLLPRLCGRGPARTTGGLFITEKAGGSDLGQSQAVALHDGNGFRLSGEKWFCANVDAGVVLTLARTLDAERTEGGTRGLGLFVLTPYLPDGRRNGMLVHRLKDSLGMRALPIGELALQGAWARQVGALEHGFKSSTEMINLMRLYSAVMAVGVMRRTLLEALRWLEGRLVFGKRAVEQPLAIEDLADLAVETQGAFHLVFDAVARLGLIDEGAATLTDRRVLRLLTPLCKYYTGQLAVWAASLGLELHGGNGYVEDFAAPRLLRDAQALPLWAGTANVCVLDALRSLGKAGVAEALFREAERKLVAITQPRLRKLAEAVRRHLDRVERSLGRLSGFSTEVLQHHGRRITHALVQSYQVALALAESDRLDEVGQGGRDFLVAERLLSRHLDIPTLETVGPWHVDPLRLSVLLGERHARVAEVT